MAEGEVHSAGESRRLLRFLLEDRPRRQAALDDFARRADRMVRESQLALGVADRVIRDAIEAVRRERD